MGQLNNFTFTKCLNKIRKLFFFNPESCNNKRSNMIFRKGIFKTYDSFQWLGDAELEITAVNVTLMMISTANKFLKKLPFYR